jgi:glutamate/tyrosine decarboxylase-like PLP-dependent enzyme
MVRLPHGPDGRAVPERYASAIGDRTALLVASAPCYPYGVIDPVAGIAGVAASHGLLCHVDACLGGWILPWWEKLGRPVPAWDFRVPGVTSLSADIHKYGYSFKGASVVLYRTRDLLERQIFLYDAWPGGLYASSSAAGTRPGAPIAGAWAAINHLGEEGYLRLTARVIDATSRLLCGIRRIEGLRITFEPDLSLFEFGSGSLDMNAVCDVMDDKGWNLDRQQGGLHLMVSPGHDKVVDAFLGDLAAAVAGHGSSRGKSPAYGGIVA